MKWIPMDDCVTTFLKTGRLGPLRLGMKHSDIRDSIGEPEYASSISRRQPTKNQILLYGDSDKINLQLVLRNNTLTAIYLYFRGSDDRTTLPEWISSPSTPLIGSLSLNGFFDWAEAANVPWRMHWPFTLEDQTTLLLPQSSVYLIWGHNPDALYLAMVSMI